MMTVTWAGMSWRWGMAQWLGPRITQSFMTGRALSCQSRPQQRLPAGTSILVLSMWLLRLLVTEVLRMSKAKACALLWPGLGSCIVSLLLYSTGQHKVLLRFKERTSTPNLLTKGSKNLWIYTTSLSLFTVSLSAISFANRQQSSKNIKLKILEINS